MAEEASFSVSRTGDRATALRESLADELEEARLVVQAAAAARKRAKRDVERLEEDIASLQKEEQTRKVCSSGSAGVFVLRIIIRTYLQCYETFLSCHILPVTCRVFGNLVACACFWVLSKVPDPNGLEGVFLPMQAASSPAKEKAELAEMQAELDKALHSYRSGTSSAEKARQIIAQVLNQAITPLQGPFSASATHAAHAPVILAAAA